MFISILSLFVFFVAQNQEELKSWKFYKHTKQGLIADHDIFNHYRMEIVEDEEDVEKAIKISGEGFCSFAGISKNIKVKEVIKIKFSYRAKSTATESVVTNISIRILDASGEKEYYTEALAKRRYP